MVRTDQRSSGDHDGALLDVRDLHTRFRLRGSTVYAVNGASFTLRAGESLGIVGESGSGKSVTALSIMGMIRWPGQIAGGQVLFRGEDLVKKPESSLRQMRGRFMSMVPQNPLTSMNPVLTIGDHLRETLWVHLKMSAAQANKRSIELLARVGLPDPRARLDEYPHRLSGGQRQRVMIALALACQPQLLIADEPTTALDVTIQAQILELLDELTREMGLATILITHNLGIVAGHCDRVVVMYAGRVVETGPVDQIFAHPRHPYTFGLLKCVPRLSLRRQRDFYTIPGLPPVILDTVQGCPFADRCSNVLDRCRQETPALAEMGPQHQAACWNPVSVSAVEEVAS